MMFLLTMITWNNESKHKVLKIKLYHELLSFFEQMALTNQLYSNEKRIDTVIVQIVIKSVIIDIH